jgi:hypothetical protein
MAENPKITEPVESQSQKLTESVKNASNSVDTTQLETTAKNAKDSLKNSIESVAGAVAGEVEGGVKSITQKFDKYQDKLNNLTTEGLIDDGIQSLENMATDFVNEKVTGFLSKFGSSVNIVFSEPDSNGIVFPIEASLDAEGGISGTVAAVLQLITGLGVDTGNLQKAIVEGSPQGILDAGKDVLSGKMGAFNGASAINALAETAITGVTNQLESTVRTALASNSNLNTVVNAISSIDSDGSGKIVMTRSPITSSRITSGNTDSDEFDTAIAKNKTNPILDLNNTLTDSKNIKQNLQKASSDLENLSGGKDSKSVLNSVRGAETDRNAYTNKGDEYRSLIRTKVAKGSQTGIIQGISTEILTDVKKRIRDFASKLTGDQVNSVINLSQGDAGDISQAVRLYVNS